MKRNLIIILLLVLAVNSTAFAQYNPDYHRNVVSETEKKKDFYARKIRAFTTMKQVGLGLGLGGGVFTVAGVALISSADWETTSTNNGTSTTTSDSEGFAGVIMVIVGVPLAVTGIVLGSIGSAKVNSYNKKYRGLSFNIDYTPDSKGIVLTYRF